MLSSLYYVSAATTDIVPAGAQFWRTLRHDIDAVATTQPIIVNPGFKQGWAFTRAGLPDSVHWDRGDWRVSVDIFRGNANLQLQTRLQRYSRTGTLLEQKGISASQYLLSPGIYTFDFPNIRWDQGYDLDRIGIEYTITNATFFTGQRVTFRFGTKSHFVKTPVREHKTLIAMPASVYLHDEKFRRLGRLVTASGINRSHVLNGTSLAVCNVDRNDALAEQTEPRRGRILVVESPFYPYPWVGKITTVRQGRATEDLQVRAKSYDAVLGQRRLGASFTVRASADVAARRVLQAINAQLVQPIEEGLFSKSAEPVHAVFSRDKTDDALDVIAQAAGMEWWLDYDVSPSRIDTFANIAQWRGRNRFSSLALVDGTTCEWTKWVIDAEAASFGLTLVGGQEQVVQALSDRASASADTDAVSFAAPHGFEVEGAEATTAELSRIERTVVASQLRDRNLVEQAAKAMLARQRVGGFTRVATVRAFLDGDIWPMLDVGSVIRLRLPTAFISGFDGPARILGTQPDEENGDMELALQLLAQP
jgi:hypothetical protein